MIDIADINFFVILLKKEWAKNIRGLEELFNVVARYADNIKNKKSYSYKLEKLIFQNIDLNNTHGKRPIDVDNVNVELAVEIEYNTVENTNDPLNKFSIQIISTGDYMNDIEEEICKAINSWHFDKHISNNETKFSHPVYHCTFGGFVMTKNEYKFCDLLLLDTPRFSYPPMDFFLAVDFIIHNFYKIDSHKKLTENADYKRLVGKSQKLLWQPYFSSIANHLNNEFNAKYLLPNLI